MAVWNDWEDLEEHIDVYGTTDDGGEGCFGMLLVPINYLFRFYLGFITMLAWLAIGIVCVVTIIGFKFGIMAFRCSVLMYKSCKSWLEDDIYLDFHEAPVKNVIWCCTVGAIMTVCHALMGACLCLSLIGIPTGITYLKSIKFIIMPFGADIY